MIKQLEATDGILSEIMHERAKQISKGYDAKHGDQDAKGNHVRAAAYYSTAAYAQRHLGLQASDAELYANGVSVGYPWPADTKTVESIPRDNLVKAAALLIAEIERIDREGIEE